MAVDAHGRRTGRGPREGRKSRATYTPPVGRTGTYRAKPGAVLATPKRTPSRRPKAPGPWPEGQGYRHPPSPPPGDPAGKTKPRKHR